MVLLFFLFFVVFFFTCACLFPLLSCVERGRVQRWFPPIVVGGGTGGDACGSTAAR